MTETCCCGASITVGSADPYSLVDEFREQHTGCADRWVRLFNRLDAAISHHKAAERFPDDHDEALWAARDRILRAAATPDEPGKARRGRDLGPAELIAKAFHDTYEDLAPMFGYRTRTASAKRWEHVPVENRRLMIATVTDLLDRGVIVAEAV